MKVTWILLFWLPLLAADAVSHRYVIELSGPSVAEHITNESKRTGKRIALDSDVAKTRRQQLRDEQKQARTALEGLGVKVLGATDTVSNTLIVDMPDSLVEQVAALPGVKRVQKARMYKTHLDHALPLHHVPDAWAVAGGMANAGTGIKIGMIDSGIDITHPGMQDSTMRTPPGFPKVNADADVAFTNGKVIVARSYAALFITVEDDLSARDVDGHGTLTAMTAAGAQNTGPYGTITGVAPKAWLGAYKVAGASGSASDDVLGMAIDDAVKDGMDVINLSFGGPASRLSDDSLIQVPVANATALGVVVVVSSGNDSVESSGWDPNTIQSPGTAPSAITVGASYNDRVFFPAAVMIAGGAAPIGAITDNGSDATNPLPSGPVSGQLFDVSTLDTIGDACLPFPKDTMTGKIALIIRGTCTFEEKMNDVQGAGAVGALIYTLPGTDLSGFNGGAFGAGAATLPAVIVANVDGVAILQQLAANPSLSATLNFTTTSINEPVQAKYVAFFSGMGPSVDGSIKPDLVAVGTDFYGATEATTPNQDLYDPSGYVPSATNSVGASGTSISAPLVAGTVALVKGLRPGLTVDQYRSLVINTAGTITSVDSVTGNFIPSRVMQVGAGLLNAQAAVTSTFAAKPTALSFNIGDGNPNVSSNLAISNVGTSPETYSLAVAPRDTGTPTPALGTSTVTVQPGQSATVPVSFTATGLGGGQYEGYITITGSQSGVQERVPYWYGVPSNVPANITPTFVASFDDNVTYRAGARINDAIEFRVTDASGILIPNPQVTVTALPGVAANGTVTGTVINTVSIDNQLPGVMRVGVTLSRTAGANIFEITVGNLQPYDVEVDGN
jgi:minor extracellular serine protease Vpr